MVDKFVPIVFKFSQEEVKTKGFLMLLNKVVHRTFLHHF